jgi:hypothetical protein
VTDTAETTSTALEPVPSTVLKGLNEGSVTYDKLVALLAPPPAPTGFVPTAKLPTPAEITPKERISLTRLMEVFGKVVPTERKALTIDEIGLLIDERQVLDDLLKLLASRKEDIRTTVLNHFDVEAEKAGRAIPVDEVDEDGKIVKHATERNKDGFYLLPDEVVAPGRDNKFKRGVTEGSPSINLAKLAELADDPNFPLLSHQDYLDMTEQVRVVRPDRVMDKLRKNPALAAAIRECVSTSSNTAVLTFPKAK